MKKNLFVFAVLMAALSSWAQEQPVVFNAPDTVIEKTAYSISEQDITISVSYGSAYPAGHSYNNLGITYFACLANGSMTISAEQDIKGIAIDGWVRKNFAASCDQGTIAYLSDALDDATGEPVLTISDINAPSVTISCDNQLRCFRVKVYFSENPDSIGGVTPPEGEVFFLEYNTAEAVYDPEYSTEGAYNYYLYFWDAENENIYVGIDIYTAEQNVFEGLYGFESGTMTEYSFFQFGENYEDYSMATEGQMVINKLEEDTDSVSGDIYSVSGYITCENGNTYNFSYTGAIPVEGVNPDEAVDEVLTQSPATKLLRNGQLLFLKNGKTYTALGAEIN